MKRYDIYWAALDPTIGMEIKKTRPCVIISPDEMNQISPRVIIAPVTSTIRTQIPFRLKIHQGGQDREILLDQIRTLDKRRLGKKLGRLETAAQHQLTDLLLALFAA